MLTSPPKRGGWIGWTLAAVVLLPLLYVAGAGPVLWAKYHGKISDRMHELYLQPINWLVNHAPDWLWWAIMWYLNLWCPKPLQWL